LYYEYKNAPKLNSNLLSISKRTKDLIVLLNFYHTSQATDLGKRIDNAKKCIGIYSFKLMTLTEI